LSELLLGQALNKELESVKAVVLQFPGSQLGPIIKGEFIVFILPVQQRHRIEAAEFLEPLQTVAGVAPHVAGQNERRQVVPV